jgi:hypothetical protein
MTSANVLVRHPRRPIVFGALVVLLHLLVFDWLSGQLGRRREAPVPAPPVPMLAQLIQITAPVPLTVPALDLSPKLAPPPLPLPSVAPEPVEVADAGAGPAAGTAAGGALGTPSAGVPDSAAATVTAAAGELERAIPTPADVQSQPVPVPELAPVPGPADAAGPAQAPPAAPAPASLPEQRRYQVELPPPADIMLDVARIDADGTRWNGEARLSWRRSGAAYRIDVEAGIRVVFARVNLLTLASEGTVGDEGFVPISMTEKRRGRAMTATHFNRKEGVLTFSASQARVALVPGTQDKASLPLQLAAIGRGDPRQMSGNIAILVGEDRDANVFSFTVAGQEQIDTRLGRLLTWHLVRPPKPGSYHSRLEVWLAPAYGWLPVQMRNVEASGAVTTQTASNIVIKEPGSQ